MQTVEFALNPFDNELHLLVSDDEDDLYGDVAECGSRPHPGTTWQPLTAPAPLDRMCLDCAHGFEQRMYRRSRPNWQS